MGLEVLLLLNSGSVMDHGRLSVHYAMGPKTMDEDHSPLLVLEASEIEMFVRHTAVTSRPRFLWTTHSP